MFVFDPTGAGGGHGGAGVPSATGGIAEGGSAARAGFGPAQTGGAAGDAGSDTAGAGPSSSAGASAADASAGTEGGGNAGVLGRGGGGATTQAGTCGSSSGAGGVAMTSGGTSGETCGSANSASGGRVGLAGAAGTGPSAGMGGAAGSVQDTLWTKGPTLLDRCGEELVIRGVEQLLGDSLPAGNDWVGLIDDIASSGANAVKILPDETASALGDLDAVLGRIADRGMVALLTPVQPSWLGQTAVRTLLNAHAGNLILEAYAPSDTTQFYANAMAAVQQLRGYGYRMPLLVISNHFGRDLPTMLQYGSDIVADDPAHNIVMMWLAHWGTSGYYQQLYGMSLEEGIAAAAGAPFPVLMGITYVTDPDEYLDYAAAMAAAQTERLGWLWWDWYNPYGRESNLSRDGSSTNLFAIGTEVVRALPASIANTSVLPCQPDG